MPLLRGEKQPGREHVFTHVNTVSSGRSFPGRCVRTKDRAYIWNAWPDGKTEYRVEAMNGLTFNALAAAGKSDPRIQKRVQHFLYRTVEEEGIHLGQAVFAEPALEHRLQEQVESLRRMQAYNLSAEKQNILRMLRKS